MSSVEDTLRYAASGGLLEQQGLALSGLGELDRSNAWRFPVTLLPGGFHQPQARGLELLGVGPEFGWFVTGVPAAVGLWLYLQGGRWRVAGIGIVAAGLAWAGFDHAMYNLYLTEHSLFGIVLGGSAAHSSSAWLRAWALLGQGHVVRVILVGALVAAFVLDEQAYCRAHAARFGDRPRIELRRALHALHERRLGLALEASRLDRRLAALALAPAATSRRRRPWPAGGCC